MNLRLRNTLIHFSASLLIAALAWLVISRLWYPAPLDALAGGTTLFLIMVCVDVAMGPLLTAVVSNSTKKRTELRRDLALIATLQMAALGYGVTVMAQARPVAIVFEVDLFRVVSAAEVDTDSLAKAPPGLRQLSWTGPRLIAVVKPAAADEQLRTIELGLAGIPLAALPQYWRPYASQAAKAWEASTQKVLPLLARGGEATVQLTAIDAPEIVIRGGGSSLRLSGEPRD